MAVPFSRESFPLYRVYMTKNGRDNYDKKQIMGNNH